MSMQDRYIFLLSETETRVAQAGPHLMVLLPKPLECWDDRHELATISGFTLCFFQFLPKSCYSLSRSPYKNHCEIQSMTTDLGKSPAT